MPWVWRDGRMVWRGGAVMVGSVLGHSTALGHSNEQDVLLGVFTNMLKAVTKDGGVKRARGEKPPWWRDTAHEPAIYSHLSKWKHGEITDPDSGAHPLVHLAWRALAIAYQETYGKREPHVQLHEGASGEEA